MRTLGGAPGPLRALAARIGAAAASRKPTRRHFRSTPDGPIHLLSRLWLTRTPAASVHEDHLVASAGLQCAAVDASTGGSRELVCP
jgi:hypothetical protein